MNHKRPEPRGVIPSLFNELENMRCFFSDMEVEPFAPLKGEGISLYEDEERLYVEAHVPGVKPENVDITFEKGVLWVKAEGKEDKKEVKYHLKSSHSFSYRLPLPNKINEGATPEATYKDGIVKIIFEKSPSSQSKKISVKKE